MRALHVSSAAVSFALLALLFAARAARADDSPKNPWIERPLALKPLTAEIQAGIGMGQATDPLTGHTSVATGANLEAGIGLPILGDINVRTGYGFSTAGQTGGIGGGGISQPRADFYGRLFDHETANGGGDTFANPEIRWRSAFVDAEIVAIGFETRFVIPAAAHTYFTASPGIPVRFRIPHLARIDTGLYVPFTFTDSVQYTFSIPVALWIQQKDFFFGPMTGFRFDHIETLTSPSSPAASKDQVDITAGLGVGYTVGGLIDIKAQLYTLRINDSNWSNLLGAGLGVGLLLPP